MVQIRTGVERFAEDQYIKFQLNDIYKPYKMQKGFHSSRTPFNLMGGAAGPGKTLGLIMEHMMTCNEFTDPVEAMQVHTLLLRRTYPKLNSTVITRFREKIPKELYRDYNAAEHIVTWPNGAQTRFGSMQHEHNAWDYQGQWLRIDYDELTEFTFTQWQATSAWNRCPVSKHTRKGGATNPIGIGADWVEHLFILKKPCAEMDEHQKRQYRSLDYSYFQGTYLDNPIYANDEAFIANLDSYTAGVSQALKMGIWGLTGGFFAGAWDEAENVYDDEDQDSLAYWQPQQWHPCWMGGDWGFEHQAAIYWMCIDEHGVVRITHEFVTKHEAPKMLAESIVRENAGRKIQAFHFSHDAFGTLATATHGANTQTVALQMTDTLRKGGVPAPVRSTRDKAGREMLLYDMLRQRVTIPGKFVYDAESGLEIPVKVAKLQIAKSCKHLIKEIGRAPRDEKNKEEIASYLGDDPLQGASYGLYGRFGRPAKKPQDLQIAERLATIEDTTAKHMEHLRMQAQFKKEKQPVTMAGDWRRRLEEPR
jgi:hypothetical protein